MPEGRLIFSLRQGGRIESRKKISPLNRTLLALQRLILPYITLKL